MSNLDQRLAAAMKSSGYDSVVDASDPRLVPVIAKLQYLSDTSRFERLLSSLFASNDKSNFHSLLFEATFAYQFELKDKHLQYEMQQQSSGQSTIDFLYAVTTNMHVYFELRLLQQQDSITKLFESQLESSPFFGTILYGPEQQKDLHRLQGVLLDKVLDRQGNPVKFFSTTPPNHNVIVVDVSEILLGGWDKIDCKLLCYGPESVKEPYRLDVYGLFQVSASNDSTLPPSIAHRFAYFREMIHGILFMKRSVESNPVDFELWYHFIPNCHTISEESCKRILAELGAVFMQWEK